MELADPAGQCEFIVHSQIFFTINFARPSKIDCATARVALAPSTHTLTHTHTHRNMHMGVLAPTGPGIVSVQIWNIVYNWALSRFSCGCIFLPSFYTFLLFILLIFFFVKVSLFFREGNFIYFIDFKFEGSWKSHETWFS